MPFKQMSGAQKRQKKKEEEEQIKKLPKMERFFHSGNKKDNEATETLPLPINDRSEVLTDIAHSCHSNVNNGKENSSAFVDNNEDHDVNGTQQSFAQYEEKTKGEVHSPTETLQFEVQETRDSQEWRLHKYPTDKSHFPETLTADDKKFIVSHGPCQPQEETFPLDAEKGGRFSTYYYTKTTKAGTKIERKWLCYSLKLDCSYCEPCWLFADKSKLVTPWANGIRAWRHLSEKIEEHEKSKSHVHACIMYEQWRLNGTVDRDLGMQILQEQNFWRQVLERLINVALTLAMNNLAFRGHRENIGECNNGNFLSIVELLAKYDPVLSKLISMPDGSVRYLSPTIQNELITILADQVENDILNDIKSAPFFSVIMDTTQDMAKIDQLSQVFRYVKIETGDCGKPKEVKIVESFLGFTAIHDQSAAGLENEIMKLMCDKGLDFTRCRGQGYDGAANMSGVYTGLRARLLKKEENALYVHCAAHNLNLVLNDSASKIPELSTFFSELEFIYVFFAHSIKRWDVLCSFSSGSTVTLKKLCPTRWSSRYDVLKAIRFRFCDILKALSKIILLSKSPDETREAHRIYNYMNTFNFVFLIVLMTKVLQTVDAVSKSLQSKDVDLSMALKLLEHANSELAKYRNKFEEAKDAAISLGKNWAIEPVFQTKRVRKVKRFHDELSEDHRLADAESYFRVNVFYACLDLVNTQLKSRFGSMKSVVEMFDVIQPTTLTTDTDDALHTKATHLCQVLHKDITDQFPLQLLSFRSCLQAEIKKLGSVKDLATLLLIQHSAVAPSFPDVCTVILAFLTLPVKTATAERSFSKLHLIKTYLRSTMGREMLRGLAILSIENERARKLDLSNTINVFAEKKARKRDFT